MNKLIKNSYFLLIVLTSLGAMISFVCKAQYKIQPTAHILMPAYNADKFIETAIQSVLEQNYPNLKLLVFNDGSTDGTFKKVQKFLEKNPILKDKIYLRSTDHNKGVSQARTTLIDWSKRENPDAYIFWLDADDKYISKSFVKDVIQQMRKTSADVCLVNFSVTYEDENQKSNAVGLVKEKEKEKMNGIIKAILSSPNQAIKPLELPNLLEVTSLGWIKCYAPTVKLPRPVNCPFEDFVYMSALLEAKSITALHAEYEPIQYLRRSTSICGQRKSKNFTHDIPSQLLKFFDTVLKHSMNQKDQLQKVEMAKGFVFRKLDQYAGVLEKIVATNSHPDINQKTLEIYRKKATAIEKYINQKLALLHR